MLGVSQMTLSKALASLRAQGLVKTGYRKVALPDPERLEAWLTEREGMARREVLPPPRPEPPRADRPESIGALIVKPFFLLIIEYVIE